jgi:hypothetical protein
MNWSLDLGTTRCRHPTCTESSPVRLEGRSMVSMVRNTAQQRYYSSHTTLGEPIEFRLIKFNYSMAFSLERSAPALGKNLSQSGDRPDL